MGTILAFFASLSRILPAISSLFEQFRDYAEKARQRAMKDRAHDRKERKDEEVDEAIDRVNRSDDYRIDD